MNGKTVSTGQGVLFEFNATAIPQDNFSGRNLNRYGLAESINLGVTITPPSLPAADIGSFQWLVESGVGTVSNPPQQDGTATYDAGDSPGDVSLRLTITSGDSQGATRLISKSIIAPSGEYMAKKPGGGVFHRQNTASAGFTGHFYLLPKDVSFRNIQQREAGGIAIGTGFYASNNGQVHSPSSWFSIANCNIDAGCEVQSDDTVLTLKLPPFSIGDFLWPISHEYRVGSGPENPLTIANQHHTADAAGRCCVEKIGAGPFCKNAADPDSEL